MTAPQRRRKETPRAARLSKAERKRQLLAHAKRLFLERGYRATTAEQVAAAAGVTEAVLRRHFDDKPALFLEVVREIREATLTRWETETAALADPLARLHAVAELYLDASRSHAAEFRILHRALLEGAGEEVAAPLRAFYLDAEAFLAQVIAEGQQTGVFRRSLDARVGAWELIRSALGYALTLPLGVPLYEENDYLPRAVECLLQCLMKTDV